MKQLYLRILKYFLPALFISYVGLVSLFVHSHVVNGVTIVHSHPFNKDVEHTHSSAEFQLINHLSQIWVTGAIVLSLLVTPLLLFFLELLPDARLQVIVSSRLTGIQLRAPPSYSLCAVFICRHRLFLRRYRN